MSIDNQLKEQVNIYLNTKLNFILENKEYSQKIDFIEKIISKINNILENSKILERNNKIYIFIKEALESYKNKTIEENKNSEASEENIKANNIEEAQLLIEKYIKELPIYSS
jgi:ABC-type transporter lipoprotein component MlaA